MVRPVEYPPRRYFAPRVGVLLCLLFGHRWYRDTIMPDGWGNYGFVCGRCDQRVAW